MAAQPFTAEDVRFLSSPEGAAELLRAADLPLSDATVLADLTRIRRTAGASRRGGGVHCAAAATGGRQARPGGSGLVVHRRGPAAGDPLAGGGAPRGATGWGRRARPDLLRRRGSCGTGGWTGAGDRFRPRPGPGADGPAQPLGVRHPARVYVADALTRSSHGLLGYADPARRDGTGRRITSVSTLPSVADLDAAHAGPAAAAAATAGHRLRRAGAARRGGNRVAGRWSAGSGAVAG